MDESLLHYVVSEGTRTPIYALNNDDRDLDRDPMVHPDILQ